MGTKLLSNIFRECLGPNGLSLGFPPTQKIANLDPLMNKLDALLNSCRKCINLAMSLWVALIIKLVSLAY